MLCYQIFLRTLYPVLQALSEWKSQSAHFLVRASLVSSRADAQTGFVALTATQWLFWVSRVSLQQCCTEIGKHCWTRNLCARINPPYLHLPSATHSSSLHSRQRSHSQDLLRKHSDLLLLSSDITPSSCAFPDWAEHKKHPWACCTNFCRCDCAPDQCPASRTRHFTSVITTAMWNEKLEFFYLILSSSSKEGAHPPPWAFRQAHDWLPIQIQVGYPLELQLASRIRLQGGGDCVKKCSLFLREEVSWLPAISKTHYLLAPKSTWKIICERNAQYRAWVEGQKWSL